jgi:hypothetical protein
VLPAPDTEFIADARAAYVAFAAELDVDGFLASYPGIAHNLRSGTRGESLDAVRMCGSSHDLRAIPLLVRELDSPDHEHQVWAGQALEQVVNAHELMRRDPARLEDLYLLPRTEGSVNLRPLCWVLDQMLRCGEPNLQSHAATMSSYIGIHELASPLQGLRASRHPAVVNAVDAALAQLARDPSR